MLIGAATLSAVVATGIAAQTIPVDVELTPVVGGMLYLGELPQSFQLTATDGSAV
jgi:hypothetical protein